MMKKITYYALVDDRSSRQEPGGVLRRIESDEGQTDEAYSRDLVWRRSPLLYAAERGDLQNKFYEIDADEAERIVERIRKAAGSR
jgi:hypothetical protein